MGNILKFPHFLLAKKNYGKNISRFKILYRIKKKYIILSCCRWNDKIAILLKVILVWWKN